ncbi:TPA: hypothetical protein ACNVX4_006307 [Pseudomonas aeruginosa]|nr:hypothetical protein [Pseudomonas aeruginosa]HCA5866814.1 hypothetical protein [Pseudomonas aeruginosa]HCA7380001.1 hypothetical protein [Pseudomonas aeruginosa]HCA7775050.1 hypothetical protein [Pseudomonas aeruginosa]
MMTYTSVSPGLAFLQAASNAMPSSLGDRATIAAMNEAMSFAVRCKMRFAKADMPELLRLRRQTCVGVFRPDSEPFYSAACAAGGTFAAAWEKHFRMKPWIAPEVLEARSPDLLTNNRVGPGLAVLIEAKTDQDLATFRGKQVWWCTSFDDTEMILCRYPCNPNETPLVARGKPARRMTLSRSQWSDLFTSAEETAA